MSRNYAAAAKQVKFMKKVVRDGRICEGACLDVPQLEMTRNLIETGMSPFGRLIPARLLRWGPMWPHIEVGPLEC